MATKTHPYNCTLGYSSDGNSYTTMSDIRSITPPTMEKGSMNITNLASTAAFRESRGGWKTPGDLSFSGYFTKAQFDDVFDTLFNQNPGASLYYFKVTFALIDSEASATSFVVTGFLKSLNIGEISAEGDDAIMADGVIECSGQPTFTEGS